MVIFNSYVSLPEGISFPRANAQVLHWHLDHRDNFLAESCNGCQLIGIHWLPRPLLNSEAVPAVPDIKLLWVWPTFQENQRTTFLQDEEWVAKRCKLSRNTSGRKFIWSTARSWLLSRSTSCRQKAVSGWTTANPGTTIIVLMLFSLDWFKGKSTGNHGFYH